MKGVMNDCNKYEAVRPGKTQSSVRVLENGQQKWSSEHAEQLE